MNKLTLAASSSSGLSAITDINNRGEFNLDDCSPKERYEKLVLQLVGPQNPDNQIDPYPGDLQVETQDCQDAGEPISGSAQASYELRGLHEFRVLHDNADESLAHSRARSSTGSIVSRGLEGPFIRSTSLPTIPKSNSYVGFLASTLVATIYAFAVDRSYRKFQEEMNRRITNSVLALRDDEITCSMLIEQLRVLKSEKEASGFSVDFDKYNSCSVATFFLTRGLAYDSNGEHEIAFIEYGKALELPIDQLLKDRIHYAYARSIRLSRCGSIPEAELGQINPDSPLQLLVQVERASKALGLEAVFDENGIPFDFRCPLTGEMIQVSAEYVIRSQIYRCEDSAIRTWISVKSTCPFTGVHLEAADLVNDSNWTLMIEAWNQTTLKKK